MMTFVYEAGAELPGLTLPWSTETSANVWTPLDLSSGYTFSLRLVNSLGVDTLTKTTNITGTSTGVTVAWVAGDLAIAPDTYTLRLRATTGSFDRDYSPANPIKIVIV